MSDQIKDHAISLLDSAIEAAKSDPNSGRAIVAAIESMKRVKEILSGTEIRVRSEKVAAKNWRAWIPGTDIEAFGPEKEQAEKWAREAYQDMLDAERWAK